MITHPILAPFVMLVISITCLVLFIFIERVMMWWKSFGVSLHRDTHKYHHHIYQLGVSWCRNGWWLVDDDLKWECRMFEIKVHLLQHIMLIDLPFWPRRSPVKK